VTDQCKFGGNLK